VRYRGRFAPSPTGRIHLGNARSALLGWLHARANGGEFLLRIEDLDRARCRPEHVETLYRDLEYLGLDWDGTPVFQSGRTLAYDDALVQLAAKGSTYPCFCTRAEIARAASAPHGPLDEGPIYPGTCRALSVEEIAAKNRPPAIRFVPSSGETSFVDLLHGPYGHDVARDVGDFVIRRNDGVASYQLAVVVDDAASGITHVLRGDDLLPSTPMICCRARRGSCCSTARSGSRRLRFCMCRCCSERTASGWRSAKARPRSRSFASSAFPQSA
jgi:glutamyl-tRNA synthetase